MQIIRAQSREFHKILFLNNIFIILGLCLLFAATVVQAQVARVIDSKGTALVERSGQLPRLLGAGERLDERDVINVARDSWAILEFSDQTRITLRPNTVFRLDSYKADAPESMLLGLVKGGLRVVTGLFGKRNPDSVKFRTAVATIGIRGTEFDARLCDADCAAEARALPGVTAYAREVVARVVEIKGLAAAARSGGPARILTPSSALYEGDAITTGRRGYIVLMFRDGARVALGPNSIFGVTRFSYSENKKNQGAAYLSLLRGHAQILTGRLAKISPDAFLIESAIGLVRPLGTGVTLSGCVAGFCGSVSLGADGVSGSVSGRGVSLGGSFSFADPAGGVDPTAALTGAVDAIVDEINAAQETMNSSAGELADLAQYAADALPGRLPGAVVRTAQRMGRAFDEGGIEAVGAILERGADRLADRAEERATSVEEVVPGVAGRLPGAVVRSARRMGRAFA
ncbi:MAG: FecR domain-containing protein, partial [Burkholderiales bacterium]